MKNSFKIGSPSGVKGWLAGLAIASLMFTKAFALPALTAAPVTLAWDASPNPSVAGYKVYFGLPSLPITNRIDVGRSTSATLSALLAGTDYYIYVVAYDNTGFESAPSNYLFYTPPIVSKLALAKQANGSMQVKFRAGLGALCRVQYTSSLSSPDWRTLTTATADLLTGNVTVTDPLTAKPPMRFYRVVPL